MGEREKATLIYLEDCMLLSRKNYASWKEVQHEYYKKYITNLEPMTCEEIIHFFEMDFGDEELLLRTKNEKKSQKE